MRQNLSEVFEAWKRGERAASGHASTDGVTIFSYMLPIARRGEDGNVHVLLRYPSKTTQGAINAIAAALPDAARVERIGR